MFDNYEQLLDEVEVCHAEAMSMTYIEDVESVIQKADRIIANAKLMGINRADAQELVNLGVLEKNYLAQVTELRDTMKGDMLGVESDADSLIGKLVAGVVIALGLILAYIIGKLIGFLIAVFGSDVKDSLSSAGISRTLGDSTSAMANKELVVASIIGGMEKTTPADIFGGEDKAIKAFRLLGYPEELTLNFDWINTLLGEAVDVQKAIRNELPEEDMPLDKAEAALNTLKTVPRKSLDKYVELSVKYLSMVYVAPAQDPKFSALSPQIRLMKQYKDAASLTFKVSGELTNIPLSKINPLDAGEIGAVQASAESLDKTNKALANELKAFKVMDRRGRSIASSYLRLSVTDPIGFMSTVTNKLIVTYLMDCGRWFGRITREGHQLSVFCRSVITAAKPYPEIDEAKSLVDCIAIVNKHAKDLPDSLKPYERVLRPTPKNMPQVISGVLEIRLNK